MEVENSAQFCLVNRVQELAARAQYVNHGWALSRAAGLLYSPAAAIDVIYHAAMVPLSTLYSSYKSLSERRIDFSLPWRHIQRYRDAIAPLALGSFFALIHPYMGFYATEPAKRQIRHGMLQVKHPVSCSPITTMSEVSALYDWSAEDQSLLSGARSWERAFEQMQSYDFFDLKLTDKVAMAAQNDTRYLLLWVPATVGDLVIQCVKTAVFIIEAAIQLVGGHPHAWMEATLHPETLIYQVIKPIVRILGSSVGLVTSLVNRAAGLQAMRTLESALDPTRLTSELRLLGLRLKLWWISPDQRILIPIVRQGEIKGNLLPSENSHLYYVLIQKITQEDFKFSLIDTDEGHIRHSHSKIHHANLRIFIRQRLPGIRSAQPSDSTAFFSSADEVIDVKKRRTTNCVFTNLVNAMRLARNGDFLDHNFKVAAAERYAHYKNDWFLFAPRADYQQACQEFLDSGDRL